MSLFYTLTHHLLKYTTSTDQIKAEREREEFDKLAKKQTIGDRGTNWMYEGHGVSGQDELQSAAAAASEAKAEEAKNESYLLGKEYVPDNQTGKGSGDFAAVNNMTGALEKASTVGATIGVGQSTTNINAAVGGGEGSTLRIQQQTSTIQKEDNNNSEWNQNFHLRHEDPMFAVSQQKRQIDKDVEKKRKLMERAGLDVRPVLKSDGDNGLDNRKRRDDGEMSDGDKRRHKKKKKRKHKSKKSRKYHHKSSSRRRRRDRSRSPSYSSDYSSSSSVSSRGRRHHDSRKHHRKDRYESRHRRSRSRSSDRNHGRGDDRRRQHHSRHSRSRSRSYSPRDRRRRHSSRSYSRSRSRDDSSNRREYDGDRRKRGRDDYNGHNNHDDRKPPSDASSTDHQRAKDDNTNTKKKAEGYGLIGTSLANRNNTSSQQQQKHDYLGPNQKLLAAKRDEIEQERRLRLEAAGRTGGGDYDEFGRSRYYY